MWLVLIWVPSRRVGFFDGDEELDALGIILRGMELI